MVNLTLKHENELANGARYAADFDYVMHQFCLQKFASFLRDKHILELGCYHGAMTRELALRGSHVHALDIDPECLRITQSALSDLDNVSYIEATFEEFEMPGNVDLVYFSHALEHTQDPLRTLRNIRARLTNQRMIVVVPNGNSLSRRIAEKMGLLPHRLCVTEFEKQIGHHITFTLSILENMAVSAGFSILSAGGIFPKIFSNGQLDACMQSGIIDASFLNALNDLSDAYTDLCASIYVVLE